MTTVVNMMHPQGCVAHSAHGVEVVRTLKAYGSLGFASEYSLRDSVTGAEENVVDAHRRIETGWDDDCRAFRARVDAALAMDPDECRVQFPWVWAWKARIVAATITRFIRSGSVYRVTFSHEGESWSDWYKAHAPYASGVLDLMDPGAERPTRVGYATMSVVDRFERNPDRAAHQPAKVVMAMPYYGGSAMLPLDGSYDPSTTYYYVVQRSHDIYGLVDGEGFAWDKKSWTNFPSMEAATAASARHGGRAVAMCRNMATF